MGGSAKPTDKNDKDDNNYYYDDDSNNDSNHCDETKKGKRVA